MARKYADIVGSTASEVTIKEVRRQDSLLLVTEQLLLSRCKKQVWSNTKGVDHKKPYSCIFCVRMSSPRVGGAQSEED